MVLNFPGDIIGIIADCLSDDNAGGTIVNIALASKEYYEAVLPSIYRSVHLPSREAWVSFFATISEVQHLGSRVKKLIIDPQYLARDRALLPSGAVTSALPKLVTLELTSDVSTPSLKQLLGHFVPSCLILPSTNTPAFLVVNAVREVSNIAFLEHLHISHAYGHAGHFVKKTPGPHPTKHAMSNMDIISCTARIGRRTKLDSLQNLVESMQPSKRIAPTLKHSCLFFYPLEAAEILRAKGIVDMVREKNDPRFTIAVIDEHTASHFVQEHLFGPVPLWQLGEPLVRYD